MKKGLVMEGGAMRCMFTAGVIDTLMKEKIKFDGAIGGSAGAAFGCNYKSRQIGRVLRYNMKYARDPRLSSWQSWLKTGDLYGADFCYRELPVKLDIFDTSAFQKNPMDFWCVATDINNGEAIYHKLILGKEADLQWIRASSSIPVFARPVEIGSRKYWDGGISDSIPIKFFEKIGYQKNVVILTQPLSYRKEASKLYPALELGGNAIMGNIMPKHIFKDMTYDQAVASDAARTKVVGNGPFIVDKVVPGESVTFKKNPYYYKGEPKVDGLKADIVSQDSIVQEMKAGKYDFASMPADQYDTYKDLSNITLLGNITNNISYIGFNMGHFDKEKGEHVFEPNKKMSDPALRKAIAYALDNEQVANETYQGLRIAANTLLTPFFGQIYADKSEVPGFTYNPEEAKKILADAGYKDTDGDGYVEDKEGKQLTITLLAPAGSQTDDAVIQQYIEWWKNVGLRVELLNGRSLDFNAYAEKLTKYADDFDMWLGGFVIGYNPDPDGLYGPIARFNFSHYVSDEHTKLISEIASEASFDPAKRVELFKQWQKFVFENPFQVPRFNTYSLTAVNKRVKHVNIAQGKDTGWEQVELLSETGEAAK